MVECIVGDSLTPLEEEEETTSYKSNERNMELEAAFRLSSKRINQIQTDNTLANDAMEDDECTYDELDINHTKSLLPQCKETLRLQQQLSDIETEYYQKKTDYLVELTEQSKMRKRLSLLEAQKLRIEIEKLKNAF